jgi:hypothetical protein
MPATRHSLLQLTPRDMAILAMVHDFHGCSVQHVHDRFWAQESSLSVTYRRVARLRAEGYIRMQRLPSLSGQGSGKAFLSLARRGRQVVAEQLEIPLSQLPRHKPAETSLFVAHHFAICDFRVALELATEPFPDRLLLSWTGEWELKRAPMRIEDRESAHSGESRVIALIPDGAFSLTYQERTQPGFLEMDMGTLSQKRLHVKLRGYLLQQATVPMPIFFVVQTESRAELIRELTVREAELIGADPTRVFVTVRNRIRNTTLLAQPIWQQAGTEGCVSLLPPSRAAGRDATPISERQFPPMTPDRDTQWRPPR